MTRSQWQRLLENEGSWHGSFTQLDAGGKVLNDTPSVVSLTLLDDGTMRQTIQKRPAGASPSEQVLEYRTLGRGILLFDVGAFSNGSVQWGPYSEFGAELGLIHQDRRLRLVQLFDKQAQLSCLTLIREWQDKIGTEQPPLQIAALVGTWVGEAVTVYSDWQPEQTQATRLTVERLSDSQIRQTLQLPNVPPISSTGQIRGNQIWFETGTQPVQVLLLPDGASSTCPSQIQPRQPFFLEAGWLVRPKLRQRIIRRYDAQGAWVSLTLVTEEKL
ncbi:MAG: DUF3598 family protein [Leptolyngbya sp. SIO4C1]|nr:DUF3598 family protein [Leptolyngbya sp. SIO4C1]